ncbi:MAG: hypothetical protein LBB83_00190 [Treponema sp.]|nr:hypothetical protein [Treponema sp.]
MEGELPEDEENGGAAAASNMGVRPPNKKNEGPPGVSPVSPLSIAPLFNLQKASFGTGSMNYPALKAKLDPQKFRE